MFMLSALLVGGLIAFIFCSAVFGMGDPKAVVKKHYEERDKH